MNQRTLDDRQALIDERVYDLGEYAVWLVGEYDTASLRRRVVRAMHDDMTLPNGFEDCIVIDANHRMHAADFIARNTDPGDHHRWVRHIKRQLSPDVDNPCLTAGERNGGTWGGH